MLPTRLLKWNDANIALQKTLLANSKGATGPGAGGSGSKAAGGPSGGGGGTTGGRAGGRKEARKRGREEVSNCYGLR